MEKHLFYITRDGQKIASGYYDNGSFVVLKGSVYNYMRVLSPMYNGQKTLEEDAIFPSPSTAASFCLNKSANGWITWKDTEGNTLDSVYRRKIDETE